MYSHIKKTWSHAPHCSRQLHAFIALISQPNYLIIKPSSVYAVMVYFSVWDDEVRLCYLDGLTWKISCSTLQKSETHFTTICI
jgi:hypothetical protein